MPAAPTVPRLKKREPVFPRVFAALAFSLVPGCLSFEAVKTTGELGKELRHHTDALAYGGELCDAVAVISENEPSVKSTFGAGLDVSTCKEFRKQSEAWVDVANGLVVYSKALKELADADPVDVTAEAKAIAVGLDSVDASALGEDKTKEAASIASDLVRLVFNSVRRDQLQDQVKAADPHVQKTSKYLREYIGRELELLRSTRDIIDNSAADALAVPLCRDLEEKGAADGTPPAKSRDCAAAVMKSGLAVALVSFDTTLLDKERELIDLDAAVHAFASSHAILRDQAQSLGKEDKKMMEDIATTVEKIYKAATKLAEPDDENDE